MSTLLSTSMRLHERDNVLVCLQRAQPGARLEDVTTVEAIPAGHKVATRAIAAGEPILKFGQIIGYATLPIAAGSHVHDHNIAMGEHDRDYQPGSQSGWVAPSLEGLPLEFAGYRRANGKVGTRNFIAIVTSVNCSASVAAFVARAVADRALLDAYPNIDGIVAFTHGSGCGMAGSGEGFSTLR